MRYRRSSWLAMKVMRREASWRMMRREAPLIIEGAGGLSFSVDGGILAVGGEMSDCGLREDETRLKMKISRVV